jgi:hypothetical protein
MPRDDDFPRRSRRFDNEEDDPRERDDDERRRSRRDRDKDDGDRDDDEFEPQSGRCPSCRSRRKTKVSWTWWGGLLGPALFSMVRCDTCRTGYNGSTGKPLGTAIALYVISSCLIGLLLFWLIATNM